MKLSTIEKFDGFLAAIRTAFNEGTLSDATGGISASLDDLRDALLEETQAIKAREQAEAQALFRKQGPRMVMIPVVDVEAKSVRAPSTDGHGGFGV